MASEAVKHDAIDRIVSALFGKLTDIWQTAGALSRTLASRDRPLAGQALDRFNDDERVDVKDGKRARSYRLAQ